MSPQELGTAFLGGWMIGVIFTAMGLALPVPAFPGLVGAGAVLLGQLTYEFIKKKMGF